MSPKLLRHRKMKLEGLVKMTCPISIGKMSSFEPGPNCATVTMLQYLMHDTKRKSRTNFLVSENRCAVLLIQTQVVQTRVIISLLLNLYRVAFSYGRGCWSSNFKVKSNNSGQIRGTESILFLQNRCMTRSHFNLSVTMDGNQTHICKRSLQL